MINRLVLGVMTAALFVGSALLWSMKAPPTDRGRFGIWRCRLSDGGLSRLAPVARHQEVRRHQFEAIEMSSPYRARTVLRAQYEPEPSCDFIEEFERFSVHVHK